ncbi:MAG: type II secretion system F family protein [Candidatus Acidiferrales bacterium]
MISLAVMTFLATLVLSVTAFLTLTARKPADLAKRLETISKRQGDSAAALDWQLQRDHMLSNVPWLNRFLSRWSWSKALQQYLNQAGWKVKPGKFVLVSGVLCLASFLLAWHFVPYFPAAVLIGPAMGMIPPLAVSGQRAQRLSKFQRNLPEAIDLLTRAVRAGHALTAGLEMISKELAEPMAGEFRTTFDEHNFGLPLRDALVHLTERVPLADMRFFVTALLVQNESGGNLAELLENLSRIIRERFRIQGEIKVRTAQGRLTSVILIALPPLLLLALKLMNPDYVDLLFTDNLGQRMLATAFSLQAIGAMLLWRIVKIEV